MCVFVNGSLFYMYTYSNDFLLILLIYVFLLRNCRGVADPLNVSDLMGNGSVHKSSIRIIDQQETVDSR